MAMSVVTGGLNLRVPKDADTMLTITAQTKSIIIHVEHKKYLMPFYFTLYREARRYQGIDWNEIVTDFC